MTSLQERVGRRRWALPALVGLLGAAMVTSTLLQGALGVLSRFIIDEFGITRSQFGLAFAAISLIGGVSSIYIGTMADRNSRIVMAGLFIMAGVSVVAAALAPTYLLLVLAVMAGGLALGAGNPVTNRVIAERISHARRGVVIGLKQAGPPLGIFLAGVLLPPIAVLWGWRIALATIVVVPAVGILGTFALMPPGDRGQSPPAKVSDLDDMVRFVVRWLTVIGVGVAFANAAAIAFLPLFAQEELSMSATTAGLAAAFMGLAGVVGRIVWGGVTPRLNKPSSALLAIAASSALSFAAIAASSVLGPVWLWVGVVGSGTSVLAWHVVAWLVIVDRVDLEAVGRASGIMHMGSTLGFASGAPLAGLLLDSSGSYPLMWWLLAVLMVAITVLTARFRFAAARR